MLSNGLELWGALGYGTGELTVTPKRAGTEEDAPALRADLELWSATVGLRATLREGGDDAVTVTGKSDAMIVQTSSGRARGDDGGRLEPARATVTRLRLGVEGERAFEIGTGTRVTPSIELGIRHDGGDAAPGRRIADFVRCSRMNDVARYPSPDEAARHLRELEAALAAVRHGARPPAEELG